MSCFLVKQASRLKGKIILLGDKSIAHRSIIISAIASGKTIIKNFPTNKDCLHTLSAFKNLGIKIIQKPSRNNGSLVVTVFGKGLYGLRKSGVPIFVGDSGTTLRLILGILAGQNFKVRLITGSSLAHRPMLRVTEPLRIMGAKISARRTAHGTQREEYPPITIRGGNLKPITYKLPVASAQVKSAILLAGLYVKGRSCVIEPLKTRDHTERLLKLFRADIKLKQNKIVIRGNKTLVSPRRIYIPGDISSASFFIILAALLPNAQILIRGVSLNPSRTGIIRVLKRMGANIKITRYPLPVTRYEPMGDLVVKSSSLKGTVIKKEEIPSLIDELPILMVAACSAEGETKFKGIGELRVKETDRIASMSENLKDMGAVIQILKTKGRENLVVQGVAELSGCRVRSFGDHRTAMSMMVAGLKAKGVTQIDDVSCINKSFPNFLNILRKILK